MGETQTARHQRMNEWWQRQVEDGRAIRLERMRLAREMATATEPPDHPACEQIFLTLLDAETTNDHPISSSSRAGNYAPRLFAGLPTEQRRGFTEAEFKSAMEALFASDPPAIVNQSYGRRADRRTRITRATPTHDNGR